MSDRSLPVLDPSGPVPGSRPPRAAASADAELAEFAIDDLVQPRFHVWTLGCQMNRSDSEEMAGALLAAGCTESGSPEGADLIVINSCSIREAAEQKVIGRMGVLARLKTANPRLRVVLTGCSVRTHDGAGRAALARRYPAVDLFLRPDEEPELTARLGLAGPTTPGSLVTRASDPGGPGASDGEGGAAGGAHGRRSSVASADLPATRAAAVTEGRLARGSATHAWLPIIYGCDKACTYCIVPYSRGPERSRPFDEVLAEARALATAGYQDVTLLGQNVNSYGHDLPPEPRFGDVRATRAMGRDLPLDGRPDIAALLRAIDALRGADGAPAIPRLRFITSHPWDLGDRLIEAMAACRSVCEHLHLPVQSGDDLVLRRMGRGYTVAAYLGLVDRLRAAIPRICLTTDIIVGFPGETRAQHETTLGLLRGVRFDGVFAAAFSPRPGTPAARLPDDVPPEEKRRRLNELLALQESISRERNEAWLGRVTEVLVEAARPHRARHGHGAGRDDGEGPAGGDLHPADAGSTVPGPIRDGDLQLTGRNRESKLVHVAGSPGLVGRRIGVRIERAGPYALVGRLVG